MTQLDELRGALEAAANLGETVARVLEHADHDLPGLDSPGIGTVLTREERGELDAALEQWREASADVIAVELADADTR